MPVLPILGLIFITLKLTHFIAWSWWLVLLPFLPFALAVLFMLGMLVLGLIFSARAVLG